MNKIKPVSLFVVAILGPCLCLDVGCGKSQEQKAKDSQEVAAEAFADAFAALEEAREQTAKDDDDTPPMKTVKLGTTIQLGSLEITPVAAELRKIRIKPLLGREMKEKGPFLVLTVRVKNISEGQVFSPFMTAEVRDNFNNELDDGVASFEIGMVDGNDVAEDISPGETGTVLLCKAVKIAKATSYQWDVTSTTDNTDDFEQWRCQTTVAEIKTAEPSK